MKFNNKTHNFTNPNRKLSKKLQEVKITLKGVFKYYNLLKEG